jgi:RNA polymerase sigma factor (sigma-70 family)
MQNYMPLNDDQQRLCAQHVKLATWLARRYASRPTDDLDSAMSAAMFGLTLAARRFDQTKTRMQFSTYAHWVIRAELAAVCERERRRGSAKDLRRVKVTTSNGRRHCRRDEDDDEFSMLDVSEEPAPAFAMLDRLSPRQRQAITLKIIEGMATTNVANAMGCTPDAVNANVRLGLAKIRRWLSDSLENAWLQIPFN